MKAEELLTKYLNDDLSAKEREDLYSHYSKEELDAFMGITSNLQFDTNAPDQEWEAFTSKRDFTNPKRSNKWKLILASLGICLIAFLVYFFLLKSTYTEIKNDTNRNLNYAMVDDTRITIAPGSSIEFSEKKYLSSRKIWLKGHAFFDVRKKGDLVVVAEDVNVHVLGTRFDVWNMRSAGSKVDCYHGLVDVSTKNGNTVSLNAGQGMVYRNGETVVKSMDDQEQPSWLNGELLFKNIPIREVYKELEPYYGVTFSGELTNKAFSGALPKDDLSKCLKILNGVSSYTYEIDNATISVSSD